MKRQVEEQVETKVSAGQDEVRLGVASVMSRFDSFWSSMIDEHEHLLTDVGSTVPQFQTLFRSLTGPERKQYKGFLRILAQGCQVMGKMVNQSS